MLLLAVGDAEPPPLDVECHTRAADIVTRFSKKPGLVTVKCPINCGADQYSRVLGAGVHPSIASMCASSVYDGVLSNSGGTIAVVAVDPMAKYFAFPDNPTHMPSVDYEPGANHVTFSFYMAKIQSPDDIEVHVRVMDGWDSLSHVGRLEIRRDGKWGAVCKNGVNHDTNREAAVLACQELGYLTGLLQDSCGNVGGHRVCAKTGYATVVGGVMCKGNEKTLMDCEWEEPSPICSDHSFDVAVECTNSPPDRSPLTGTPRIVDASGAPAHGGSGRLEMWRSGGWGSVCDDGWSAPSAAVACRQMGYTGIKNDGYVGMSCDNVYGANFCADVTAKIAFTEVHCSGKETGLRRCPLEAEEDIFCVHTEDVVISCDGEGDPSGMGLLTPADPPAVRPRPFSPKVELTCEDRPINKKELKGTSGAVFVVQCPEACSEATDATITGTYIYTDDSAACRAGIHAGVLTDEGGEMLLSLALGQQTYMGSERNAVTSKELMKAYPRAFTVMKTLPSVTSRLLEKTAAEPTASVSLMGSFQLPEPEATTSFLQLFSRRLGSSPAEDPSSAGTAKKESSADEDGALVSPVALWCPPMNFPGFSEEGRTAVNLSETPSGDALNALTDFTAMLVFRLKQTTQKWQVLIAHSDCLGFALEISAQGRLVFEQLCSPHTFDSGFVPPTGEWVHVAVSFYRPDAALAIYVNGARKGFFIAPDLSFTFTGPVVLGRAAVVEDEYFNGDISAVRVYGEVLTASQISKDYKMTKDPLSVCPSVEAKVGKRYTVDGRPCLSSCMASEPEAENIEPLEKLHAGRKKRHPAVKAIPLRCTTRLASAPQLDGKAGQRFLVSCPPDCGLVSPTADEKEDPLVDKESPYASDVPVCLAAVKEGVLSNLGGGVRVELTAGTDANSILRYFTVSDASEELTGVRCDTKGTFLLEMPVSTTRMLQCPAGCGQNDKTPIYGSRAYHPHSSVCRAAVHAGALDDDAGGQIIVEATGSSGTFEAYSTKTMISQPADDFIRAFRFIEVPLRADYSPVSSVSRAEILPRFREKEDDPKEHSKERRLSCPVFRMKDVFNIKSASPLSAFEEIDLDPLNAASQPEESWAVTNDVEFTIKHRACPASRLPRLLLLEEGEQQCVVDHVAMTFSFLAEDISGGLIFNYDSPKDFYYMEVGSLPYGLGYTQVLRRVGGEMQEVSERQPQNIDLNKKYTLVVNMSEPSSVSSYMKVGLDTCQKEKVDHNHPWTQLADLRLDKGAASDRAGIAVCEVSNKGLVVSDFVVEKVHDLYLRE